MTEPVRPLEALIAEWRVKAEKAWHVGHDDVEDGVWSYQHEANGRASAMRQCADELTALLQAAAPPAPTCPHCHLPPVLPKECTPEINDVINADIARDWELFEAGRQHEAEHHLIAAPPAPTAEPRYAESSIRQFIGWLSVDIPELHAVVIPDLADSWDRFKQRMLGSAPPAPTVELSELKHKVMTMRIAAQERIRDDAWRWPHVQPNVLESVIGAIGEISVVEAREALARLESESAPPERVSEGKEP